MSLKNFAFYPVFNPKSCFGEASANLLEIYHSSIIKLNDFNGVSVNDDSQVRFDSANCPKVIPNVTDKISVVQ